MYSCLLASDEEDEEDPEDAESSFEPSGSEEVSIYVYL